MRWEVLSFRRDSERCRWASWGALCMWLGFLSELVERKYKRTPLITHLKNKLLKWNPRRKKSTFKKIKKVKRHKKKTQSATLPIFLVIALAHLRWENEIKYALSQKAENGKQNKQVKLSHLFDNTRGISFEEQMPLISTSVFFPVTLCGGSCYIFCSATLHFIILSAHIFLSSWQDEWKG